MKIKIIKILFNYLNKIIKIVFNYLILHTSNHFNK